MYTVSWADTYDVGGGNGDIGMTYLSFFVKIIILWCYISVIHEVINTLFPKVKTMENTTIEIKGRHDPAIVHRARVVVDSLTAFVLADFLAGAHGTQWLAGKTK